MLQAIRECLWEEELSLDCSDSSVAVVDVDLVRNIQGRQYRLLILSLVTDVKSVMDTLTDNTKRHNDLGFLAGRITYCDTVHCYRLD